MADPLSVIGSASAIVQLIGGVSSGLRTLRNAALAIKDAPKVIKRLEDKIQHLGQCLKMLETYFQQRPAKIPFETQLYELIQDIARSCMEPLEVLKEKTPTHLSKKNVAAAWDLWLNDNTITQAKTQIDEYIPYLYLLIQTLNLFKADQTDALLREVSDKLNQPSKHRLPSQDAAVYELNHHSLETTIRGIRTFANNAATFIAVKTVSKQTATSSTYVGQWKPGHTPTVSSPSQVPAFPTSKRQLDHEWEQNRKDLERLINYRLFESAETIQRRGLQIKEELSSEHGVLFTQEEQDEMEEQLADILIECKVEGSTEKAVSLLERKLSEDHSGERVTQHPNSPRALPSSSSSLSPQRRLSFHCKLGRLYKETNHLDHAHEHLRKAFNDYAEETPQDIQKIRQVGMELLELYDYRVEFGDTEHRPISMSQKEAFKTELHGLIGQPLEQPRPTCDKALAWCEKEGITVSLENDGPRFDAIDEEGSSPLHRAAESCDDELALQQMMDNCDTLESRDASDDTPLLVAVSSSNTKALAVLLQKGASVKVRDSQQQTPLHRSQKPAVTKFLLHHRLRRASTITTGPLGGCGDDAARRHSASSSSSTTFTTSPPASIVIADQDLDIDAQDSHRKTALYLACSQGREKTVGLLLQARADPNIAAHESTPLSIAIESQARAYTRDPKKKVNIVAALVARGADPEPGREALRASGAARGMQKGVLKALEGPVQPPPRRDSGYQPSLSSIASGKPQLDHLEFGPDWSAGFGGKPEG